MSDNSEEEAALAAREAKREYNRVWRERNREKVRAYSRAFAQRERLKNPHAANDRMRAWRRKNVERAREHSRKSHRKNPTATIASAIRRAYGLTLSDVAKMWEHQAGKCAACFRVMDPWRSGKKPETAVIDHCHVTGRVRGLLHSKCNTVLGYLEKNRDLIPLLSTYAGLPPERQ